MWPTTIRDTCLIEGPWKLSFGSIQRQLIVRELWYELKEGDETPLFWRPIEMALDRSLRHRLCACVCSSCALP